ncbi:uncharacterized protein LAJ45_09895 [Morchella importuna]|uniref:uncharacterized protein n=1 Tax=Morchella importuna TaxID=1174673 RepID=UPI001E8ECB9F|nr:uncharacterized protein LAJ45_09895 [Morchella importuna]KAH8145973.1 hypothetical protein LAJ45_09895 [Morchella importuna]
MKALKLSSGKGINNSIQARLRSIKSQIGLLEDRLKESTESVGRDISPHLAVNQKGEEYSLIDATEAQSEENKNLLNGSATRPNKKPDPWTTISFEHDAKSDSTANESKAFGYDGSNLQTLVRLILTSLAGGELLFTPSRLHSELFHGYEIDAPQTTKLSPGAPKIQSLLAARNDEALAEYGLFPTYPTAFIVAANTEIEIACGEAHADEFMKASASNTNMAVRYGPWGAKASANLKTENSSSNSRMEATATGMKLSFQAPQIIGWVSEILPQLPRAKKTPEGGMTGGPIALFRNHD